MDQPSRRPNAQADAVLRRVWKENRQASAEELELIRVHVSASPFNPAVKVTPRYLRGATYQGRPVRAEERSLFLHLVQRVVRNRQWADGTTARQYLADLRRAVRSHAARLVLYEDDGDLTLGIVAPNVVPAYRQGANAGTHLYVV